MGKYVGTGPVDRLEVRQVSQRQFMEKQLLLNERSTHSSLLRLYLKKENIPPMNGTGEDQDVWRPRWSCENVRIENQREEIQRESAEDRVMVRW